MRPFADGTCCSGLGPVKYTVQPFYVDVAGAYNISSAQTGGWDGYIFVYLTTFDPSNQTLNFVAGDDDGDGGIGTSDIDGLVLSADTIYQLVTTGFANGDEGAFMNTIDGPGNIFFSASVPTMSEMAMIALFLMLAGVAVYTLRRQRLDV